jgi:hypothetical protein
VLFPFYLVSSIKENKTSCSFSQYSLHRSISDWWFSHHILSCNRSNRRVRKWHQAVVTGTAVSPHIMVSWYLVSRSCFVVGNGRPPACLNHIVIVFVCAAVQSVRDVCLESYDRINLCCKRHVVHLFSYSLDHSALLPHASCFLFSWSSTTSGPGNKYLPAAT